MEKSYHQKLLEDKFEVSGDPIHASMLAEKIDDLIISMSSRQLREIVVMSGNCVPEAKPETYDSEAFEDSYVTYIRK